MKPVTRGMFARSLAGHDKGKLYVIVDTDGTYVYLADGKIRTMEHPKKKKQIHIQLCYESTEARSDEEIRKALKAKGKEDLLDVENRCD